jgi:hypothetical protein
MRAVVSSIAMSFANQSEEKIYLPLAFQEERHPWI